MTINDIKNAVASAAKEFPIKRAVLFGSRAEGTHTDESDVDLIMEFNKPITLITLSLVKQYIEDILHAKVDIIHGPIQSTDLLEIDKELEIYAA